MTVDLACCALFYGHDDGQVGELHSCVTGLHIDVYFRVLDYLVYVCLSTFLEFVAAFGYQKDLMLRQTMLMVFH